MDLSGKKERNKLIKYLKNHKKGKGLSP